MTSKCIYFCTFAIILLVFSPGNTPPLRAQQSSGQAKSSPETPETAKEPERFEAAGNLIEKTLANDIHTAGYYELVSWCRDLGLEDTGTRQALQRRLYAYYRISPPPAETEPEGKSRLLEIKSAKETQYFTIEQVDEDYVLLLGDVLVEIKEEEATHRIRAHRILLNETERKRRSFGVNGSPSMWTAGRACSSVGGWRRTAVSAVKPSDSASPASRSPAWRATPWL
jgi:hypothetical protein